MGQVDLMLEIWAERDHISFVSGQPLAEEMNAWCFAHVLGKGAYPRYKLNKENIVLMTPQEHYKYDHETHKAREDSNFDKVFELADKLRLQYNTEI